MDQVKATDKLFLFRVLGEEGNAWKLAFQTDNSTSESRSYDTTETKDGAVKAVGAYDGSHSLSSLLPVGDTNIATIKAMVRTGEGKLEVWDIDRTGITDDGTPQISGDYSVDVVTSISESSGSDGGVEISIDTEIEKGPISGSVTVTDSLKAMLLNLADEFDFVQPTDPTLVAPTITGPTTMVLEEGYDATSSGAFTITGAPVPAVLKASGDVKIAWNDTTKKLDIAQGLEIGNYPVVLTVTNGVVPSATSTFTLIVSDL